MTAHRSRLRTSPETYARASLLHDGARLPLATVADALDVEEDVAARLVAFGRLHVADEVVILPPGCGPHLGGLVSRTQRTVLHLTSCESCQSLEAIMQRGIRVSRARWTNGAEPPPSTTTSEPPPSPQAAEPAPPPPAATPVVAAAAVTVPGPPRMTSPKAVVAVPVPAAPAVRVHAFRWAPPSPAATWAPPQTSRPAPPPVQSAAPPQVPSVTDALVRQVRLADPTSDTHSVEQALRATLAETAPLPRVTLAPTAVQEPPRSRRTQVAAVVAAVVAVSGGVLLSGALPEDEQLTATTLSAPAAAVDEPATRSADIDEAVRAALSGTGPDDEVRLGTVDLDAPGPDDAPAATPAAPPAPVGEVPTDRDVLTRALTAILRDARPQPVPPPAPPPPPAPAPAARATAVDVTDPAVWDRLALCESSGRWDADTGNGYSGGLQFTQSSWELVGGTGRPHEASREEQISRAQRLWAIQGWGAWPDCSRNLGYR